MGSDFLTLCTADARGTVVERKGEHPACKHGAHSTVIVAHSKVVSSSTREHVPQCASSVQLGSYCSTRRASAPVTHSGKQG